MAPVAEKRERVEQLQRLGFNVPRMLLIPAGTTLDANWLERMEAVRNGDALMTVRSYHPTDEIKYTQGPFYPERPAKEALVLAVETLRGWNVLWQEAIPACETVLCGDILVFLNGDGWLDAARGPGFRVRDVHMLDRVPDDKRLTISFGGDSCTRDPAVSLVIRTAQKAARLLHEPNGVVLEFNVQETPVGIKRERLLFWEWRPVISGRKKVRKQIELPKIIEDRNLYTFGPDLISEEVSLPGSGAVGGKGNNLLAMSAAGLPIPSGIIIPISICQNLSDRKNADLLDNVLLLIKENLLHKNDIPLLSIRSSPSVSLPGLLKTVVNVGITDEVLRRLAKRCPIETQKEIIESFLLSYTKACALLAEEEVRNIIDLKGKRISDAIEFFEVATDGLAESGVIVPSSSEEQIVNSIIGIINFAKSKFRQREGLKNAAAAVIVQRMVFGNLDANSGSGVLFTRNPNTGDVMPLVEFIPQAQGHEVVSGRQTPEGFNKLKDLTPQAAEELLRLSRTVERKFGDMQEIEFTIQSGELWILQARSGARSSPAALKISYDFFCEGLIDEKTACKNLIDLDPTDVIQEDIITSEKPIAQGIGASPGVATGRVSILREAQSIPLEPAIWVIDHFEKGTDLLEKASGIIALRGGVTSHGVVLARSLGIPVVVQVCNSRIQNDGVAFFEHKLRNGEYITIDGSTGKIFCGALEADSRPIAGLSDEILNWFLNICLPSRKST